MLKFNMKYEKLLENLNNMPIKNSHIKVVSPLRTKQPSINNSRRISKEREISNSHNSVQSPRIRKQSGKGGSKLDGRGEAKTVKSKLPQKSFPTKPNCKSVDNSSVLSKSQEQNKEVMKLLKKIIKEGQKSSQPSGEKSCKTTKPGIISQSNKANQFRQLS